MTHEDRGHYAGKHDPDRRVNPEIAEAVKKGAVNGEIPCAAAHKTAGDLKVTTAEVGFTADLLEMRIVKCQLGLFGYVPEKKIVRPAEKVSQDLEGAILESLDNGRLSCRSAWDIAEKFGTGRMQVSSACEALKIKISSCQLGAF